MSATCKLRVALPQHPQDCKEQIQNIEVKSDGGPDVLIICKALDEVLGIVDYIAREENSTSSTDDSIRSRTKWEEHLHESRESPSQINSSMYLKYGICSDEKI